MSAPIPLEQRVLAIVATVLGADSLDRIELAMAGEREVGFNAGRSEPFERALRVYIE